jgi:DNA (cytosine-5)-methyltransferase 1
MIKIGTDFSGIGSPEQAIKNLGIPHKVVFACDIDKYARQTYLENHECGTMYTDITTRNHEEVPQLDLYVAGFPCQAFSLAGKREGFEDVRGTLFFNVAEFIKINQPKAFILENVKGLLSHDSGRTFQTITDLLSNGGGTVNGQMSFPIFDDGLGYHINYQVLNTKEHGIPQNRERIFIVGFKEYQDYRFPIKEPLNLKLKDILENEVDEKFYLSEKMLRGFIEHKKRHDKTGNGFGFKISDKNSISNSIQTKQGRNTDTYIKQEGFINQNTQASQVISDEGISNNLCSSTHGYAQGYVKIKSATKKGYEEAKEGDSINFSVPNSKTRRGRVGKGVAQTLDTACNQAVVTERIRRLTPLECFRLQGFPDDFKKVVSDTQLYKQAGNSITVNVIQKVINNMKLCTEY